MIKIETNKLHDVKNLLNIKVLKFGIPSNLKLKSNRQVNSKLDFQKKSSRKLPLNIYHLIDGLEMQLVNFAKSSLVFIF